MSSTDPLTPNEQALLDYLRTLREQAPSPSSDLVKGVIRTARWQAIARPYLLTSGMLANAVATGLRLLIGNGQRRA